MRFVCLPAVDGSSAGSQADRDFLISCKRWFSSGSDVLFPSSNVDSKLSILLGLMASKALAKRFLSGADGTFRADDS